MNANRLNRFLNKSSEEIELSERVSSFEILVIRRKTLLEMVFDYIFIEGWLAQVKKGERLVGRLIVRLPARASFKTCRASVGRARA